MMKRLLVTALVALIGCSAATATPSPGQQLGQFGLGILGAVVGAAVAVAVISVSMENIEPRAGRVAVVVGSLTLFSGMGAATGVLAGGKIWNINGSVGGSILGGMVGGFACAFVEPLLYTIGIPEGWTEFLGMALIPILPALGAMVGFGR